MTRPRGDRASRARLTLARDLARSLHAGHPWIYRQALRPPERPPGEGEVVLIIARSGRPVGRGFWSAAGPIAVRMLTTDAAADIGALVRGRLAGALDRRLALLAAGETDAFRWAHGEADMLPGVHVDLYGPHASVRFDGAGAACFYLDRLPELGAPALPQMLREVGAARAPVLPVASVIERGRGGRAGGGPAGAGRTRGGEDREHDHDRGHDHDHDHDHDYDYDYGHGHVDGAVGRALLGTPPAEEIEVRENGLRFGVDLVRGQKGGLFLDQRDNRQRVRALARDKRVLNLFAYSGGFSVYAAAGGAVHTTTVDVAPGAIAAARRNFLRNGLAASAPAAAFAAEDAFSFLDRARSQERRWDLVVSDPPSFAPSRRALPAALAAYRRLHRLCAGVVAGGGLLCAASCSSHVDEAAFLGTVEAGCRDAGRRFRLTATHGAASDHPVLAAFPEGRYLKMVMGVVD